MGMLDLESRLAALEMHVAQLGFIQGYDPTSVSDLMTFGHSNGTISTNAGFTKDLQPDLQTPTYPIGRWIVIIARCVMSENVGGGPNYMQAHSTMIATCQFVAADDPATDHDLNVKMSICEQFNEYDGSDNAPAGSDAIASYTDIRGDGWKTCDGTHIGWDLDYNSFTSDDIDMKVRDIGGIFSNWSASYTAFGNIGLS